MLYFGFRIDAMYKKSKLSNGIRLITTPIEDAKTATIIAMFGTGSRYESADINGMSHFLEHMFFKGTVKRPTSVDISRELDGVGAEFNAFTSKDHTAYYVKVAHEHLPMAIDVVADMLLNSTFDAEELEKEKGVIVEELNMYRDNPLMRIHDIFEEEMYKGNSLGWDIGGSAETVRAATRESMVHYKETHYRPDNTVISVAGNLPEDIEQQIESAFSALEGEATEKHNFPQFSLEQQEPRVKIEYKESEQAQVALGFPAYAYNDPKRYIAQVLATILGGNMSSRLFVGIREKRGLAYMVRASVDNYHDTGSIIIQSGLEKTRIPEAVAVIKEELKRISEEPVTEQELKDAKEYIIGKTSISLEDSASLAQWYASQEVLLDEISTPSERFDIIRSVTAEQIQEVAKELFDLHKATLAIIGPYKDDTEFIDLLKE